MKVRRCSQREGRGAAPGRERLRGQSRRRGAGEERLNHRPQRFPQRRPNPCVSVRAPTTLPWAGHTASTGERASRATRPARLCPDGVGRAAERPPAAAAVLADLRSGRGAAPGSADVRTVRGVSHIVSSEWQSRFSCQCFVPFSDCSCLAGHVSESPCLLCFTCVLSSLGGKWCSVLPWTRCWRAWVSRHGCGTCGRRRA